MIGLKLLDYGFSNNYVTAVQHLKDKERTFHIFYQLIAGLPNDEKEAMKLAEGTGSFAFLNSDYNSKSMLGRSGTLGRSNTLGRLATTLSRKNTQSKDASKKINNQYTAAEIEDAEKFQTLTSHLKSLGIGRRTQSQIFKILAAILHLGNIAFITDQSVPEGSPLSIKGQSREHLDFAAYLLLISPTSLENALIYKSKRIGGDLCSMILSPLQASKQRDRFCEVLYGLVFSWLIEHINKRLCKPEDEVELVISLCDFPGIRSQSPGTSSGSFDLFFRNFAFEKIIAFVNAHHFDSIEKLILEGFDKSNGVEYNDNYRTLDLFMGTANIHSGFWSCLINDSQKSASSEERAEAILKDFEMNLRTNPNYIKPHANSGDFEFGVRHFSGVTVSYDLESFYESEEVMSDFVALFRPDTDLDKSSTDEQQSFISMLFSKENGIRTLKSNNGRVVGNTKGQEPLRKPSIVRRKKKDINRSDATVSESEKSYLFSSALESVDELISTFDSMRIWTIYTLPPKPSDKYSDVFNLIPLSQIRKIIDVNINTGTKYSDFVKEYAQLLTLSTKTSDDPQEIVRGFFDEHYSYWPNHEYFFGKTRLFLNLHLISWLDSELLRLQPQNNSDVNQNQAHGEYQKYMNLENSQEAAIDWSEVRNSRRMSRRNFTDMAAVGDNFDMDGRSEDEQGSQYDSEYVYQDRHPSKIDVETGHLPEDKSRNNPSKLSKVATVSKKEVIQQISEVTRGRKCWTYLTWLLTWPIPGFCLSFCGGMKRGDIRMAWREKVAICIIIFIMCCGLLFFVIGLGMIICPSVNVKSQSEVKFDRLLSNGKQSPFVAAYGRYYDVSELMSQHIRDYGPGNGDSYIPVYQFKQFYGEDVSKLFYKNDLWNYYCPGLNSPDESWDNLDQSVDWMKRTNVLPNSAFHRGNAPAGYPQPFVEAMNKYAIGKIGWQLSEIASMSSSTKVYI